MIARQEVYALIFGVLIVVISACGMNRRATSPLRFFETTEDQLKSVINEVNGQTQTPQWPKDRALYNDDYPIELALYQDGVFHYNLPRLGSGSGTWTMEEGVIKLKAKHDIEWMDFTIDMQYQMGAADAEGKAMLLHFSDRFGPKDLLLSKRNIE